MSSVTSSSNRCDGNFPERILWATIHRMSARLRSRAMQCTTIILYMFSEHNAKKKKISCASQHTHSRSSRVERFIENTSCMHNAYTEFCSVGPAIQCPATQQTILIVLCTYAISKMQFQNATAPPIQTHICDHIRFSYMVWSHMHFQIFIKKKSFPCVLATSACRRERNRERMQTFVVDYGSLNVISLFLCVRMILPPSLSSPTRCGAAISTKREKERESKNQNNKKPDFWLRVWAMCMHGVSLLLKFLPSDSKMFACA